MASVSRQHGKTRAMHRAQVERKQRLNHVIFMCHLSARGPQLPDPAIQGAVMADEMLQRALNVHLESGDMIWTPPASASSA
jgi:hypothetical protein